MLVTVDTDHIDLVHNTEVLEAALDELPAGCCEQPVLEGILL